MTARDQLGRQLREHPLRSRIQQVFGDSSRVDWKTFCPPFNLIFVDGCHKYQHVLCDSNNARRSLARGGAIVWHDYGIFNDVSQVVDILATSTDLKIYAIEGTRLAVGFAPQ
jgi:hypothetical protein